MRGIQRSSLLLGASLFFALAGCATSTNSSSSSDTMPDIIIPGTSSSSLDTVSLEKGDGTYGLKGSVDNSGGSLSYEIFVRSFYDSDGDGVGDFKGVAEKAGYLKKLGVGQVWLMPVNPSPSYHGYDVTDYYGVNSEYGTMDDFKSMLSALKSSGINVLIDMVLNHSSKEHEWFSSSYEDEYGGRTDSGSKADWYNWSTGAKTGYSRYKSLYYESRFDSSMPDFNWDSPTFKAEVKKILNYWLDLGVAGFRLDAVRYYYYGNNGSNISALSTLVDDVKDKYPNAYFVGENWTSGSEYTDYYASGINSFFCFEKSISGTDDTLIGTAKGTVNGDSFSRSIASLEATIKSKNPKAVSSYFLSNHDQDRVSKSLTGDYAKMGASLTYLLPGTPWCYYGEEIEMKGTRITSPDDQSDVRRRLPMVWSSTDSTGKCNFPESNRSDLSSNDQVSLGADEQLAKPMSLVSHMRKLGEIRNSHKDPFRNGAFTAIQTGKSQFVAYRLAASSESIVVVHNLSDQSLALDVSSFASSLLESVDASDYKPSLAGGKLGLGGHSSAILSAI